jgi:hypothetical protein
MSVIVAMGSAGIIGGGHGGARAEWVGVQVGLRGYLITFYVY